MKVASRVELKVPVSGDYVSVVRLLVSGLGTRLGLAFDELDKLKLLVGEAFLEIVARCEQASGLIHLQWKEDAGHVFVSLSDPSGKHRSVTDSGSLELLRKLGGEYTQSEEDGVQRLDIGFRIKYKEERPFLFYEREDGKA